VSLRKRGRMRKVLVIDESASVRTSVWMVLREEYVVLTVGDWQEALVWVEREGVDLVLAGVDCSLGYYGWFFRSLRGRWPTLPVLLLLGEGVEWQEGFDLVVSDRMEKKFLGEMLPGKVVGLLFREGEEEEGKVKEEERVALGDEALAMLAHEIKNPLVAISTFAYLLPEKYGDEEFRGEFYRVVGMEVRRVKGLLESLLEFTRFSKVRLVENDLNESLRKVLREWEGEIEERGVRLEKELGDGLPPVLFDGEQLIFVLRRILASVLAKVGSGGYLRLGTGLGVVGSVEMQVEFGVEVGLEGMNLGLFMVRRVLQRNGGEIEVRSVGGRTMIHLRFRQSGSLFFSDLFHVKHTGAF